MSASTSGSDDRHDGWWERLTTGRRSSRPGNKGDPQPIDKKGAELYLAFQDCLADHKYTIFYSEFLNVMLMALYGGLGCCRGGTAALQGQTPIGSSIWIDPAGPTHSTARALRRLTDCGRATACRRWRRDHSLELLKEE